MRPGPRRAGARWPDPAVAADPPAAGSTTSSARSSARPGRLQEVPRAASMRTPRKRASPAAPRRCASRWPHLQMPQGRACNAILDDVYTDARTVFRQEHRAIGLDVDRRVDQVLCVVAPARGDVTGQTEVGERRQVEVVRPADARLEHAAVPDGDTRAGADVVH